MKIVSRLSVTTVGCLLILAIAAGTLRAEDHPKIDPAEGWRPLLADKTLPDWESTDGRWTLDDEGVLTHVSGGDIWTGKKYGDFMLDLEFKVAPNSNSGVGIRVATAPPVKKKPWWYGGALEVQIHAPSDRKTPNKHDCGAIFDVCEPSRFAQKPVGQWNRYTIIAKGTRIKLIFNGQKVLDLDVNDWPTPHKNPDGTRNKYPHAIKDIPRAGHILLQYHNTPVWFRNIYIKELGTGANDG